MKISINNFKSIGSLVNYEMRPLTILSGTNSSGKSSFIQLLLLLKQTLEIDSTQFPLLLNGNICQIYSYLDVLKDRNKNNKLKVGFIFNKSELDRYKDYPELSFYELFDYDLQIEIEFDINDMQIRVSSFVVKIITENKPGIIKFENQSDTFKVETNVAVFSNLLYGKEYSIRSINYSSFVPTSYEILFNNGVITNETPKLDGIRAVLKKFFYSLNYVGPHRNSPQDIYSANGRSNSVGIDGGNVAEVFCELSERPTVFCKIEDEGGNLSFVKSEDTFLNAAKYWLCERFKLCSDIFSVKEADSYIIYVVSLSGITSTIKHVGYGISQILPIIVEGLRIKENETIILEQPEIHLHPKVQSDLADFLISLVEQGKKVIIETHSDHLITRLRRRIAEDSSNQLDDKTLLTFVEVGTNDVLFRNIYIDDLGVIELPYPDNFIENPDFELTAILKAQMKKRLNARG